MKRILKEYRSQILIGCAAITFIAMLAALYFTYRVEPEILAEVPPGRIYDAGEFGEDIVAHDSSEGVIVIDDPYSTDAGIESTPAVSDSGVLYAIAPMSSTAPKVAANPEAIWTEETYSGNHTTVEKAQLQNGSLGVLTIPSLYLSVNVYESLDNMEAMNKGVAHFPSTSAFDGNVGLSAHNINLDGSDGYFKNLHTLKKGDSITYMTALGERRYAVESVAPIAASDWMPLGYTDDHRLTLITCISGQPDKRLCVKALEAAK